MRIVGVYDRLVPISRCTDPSIPSGGLTTTIVAIVTDGLGLGGSESIGVSPFYLSSGNTD